MGRRAFGVHELVEVFRRWQAGESPRRIAKALGLVRNTVRNYLRAAEGAGIGRERVLSSEEWAVFVGEHLRAGALPRDRARGGAGGVVGGV